MRFSLAVAAVMFALSATADRGTLCFVEKKAASQCQSVDGATIAIAPADAERPFAWTSADGKRVVAGIAPAKAETVKLAGDEYRDVTLAVSGDKQRGWPLDVRITMLDRTKHEWGWVIPRKQIANLAVIAVPPGAYQLSFAAEHHQMALRRIVVEKNTSLREVALLPLPMVSAKIVSSKNEPIAGATIVTEKKRVIATSDEQGNARGELIDPVPDAVVMIEKAGYGMKIMPLDLVAGDANLGTIQLGPGHKLALRIKRPDGTAVSVRIARKNETKYEHAPIASRNLAANEETLSLDDAGPGTYYVEVAGKEPLEHMTDTIEVKEDDVERTILVEPFKLEGTVRMGEDPLSGRISVQDRDHMIRTEVAVDAAGHFGGSMWQHGIVSGFVSGPQLQAGEPVDSPELGADPSVWTIAFPKRFITGAVMDADTHQPIAGAPIGLFVTGKGQFYSSIKADADGRFSIAATKAGTYELKFTPQSYVPSKIVVEVADTDVSMQRDVALSHGLLMTVQVTTAAGAPVTGAQVVEGLLSDGHNPEFMYSTDGSGTMTLRVLPGQRRTLFVLPQGGSFAIAHVVAPSSAEDAKPLRIVIPPPVASLRVKIAGGKPPMAFGMRFNGEEVPPSAWMRLPHNPENGMELQQLPAGTYEIWPADWRTREPKGPSKTVGISGGLVEVDLAANGSS